MLWKVSVYMFVDSQCTMGQTETDRVKTTYVCSLYAHTHAFNCQQIPSEKSLPTTNFQSASPILGYVYYSMISLGAN